MAKTKVSGAWKDWASVHTKVSGTWAKASKVFTKVNGVWQIVWQAVTRVYEAGIEHFALVNGYKTGADIDAQRNADNLTIKMISSPAVNGEVCLETEITVDVSGHEKLYVEWSREDNVYGYPGSAVGLATAKLVGTSGLVAKVNKTQGFPRQISELDISGFEGEYYLVISFQGSSEDSWSKKLTIYNLWLE